MSASSSKTSTKSKQSGKSKSSVSRPEQPAKVTDNKWIDIDHDLKKTPEKRKQQYEGVDEKALEEIGYVHDLSEKTRNKNNTMDYCTFKLQTSPNKFKDALLYSPTKRKILKTSEDSRTPIKVEKFTYTKDGKKIIVNEVTRLSSPDASECVFQYVPVTPSTEKFTTIQNVLDNADEYDKVNVEGKVFHLHENPPNNTNLHLASGLLVDEEATIPIDVWEPHISSIQEINAYAFMSLTVRVWNGKKKVALGRQGKLYALTDSPVMSVTEDNVPASENEFAAIGIEEIASISSIEVFHACVNCNKKLIQVSGWLISQCDKCGHAMKLSKCRHRVLVSFVIEDQDKQMKTLTAFQEQLASIVSIDMLFDKSAIQQCLLTSTGINIEYNKTSLVVTKFVQRAV
jgi:ribosomal protein L37AE/L43A